MSEGLKKAQLIPFDSTGETALTAEAIELDFNPETLTIKVTSGQEQDAKRRGNQQVQHVGNATATLSFDAIFDSTRPKGMPGEGSGPDANPEDRDVRYKTAAIANLLQVEDKTEKPAPRRVLFSWGTTQFQGLLKTFSETIDFFSTEGVALRSKVSISITEQRFRYHVDSGAVSESGQKAGAGVAGELAASASLDSLFDLSVGGGFAFDASLDLSVGFSAGFGASFDAGLGVDVGVDVDLGFSATAGIDLNANAALGVFGDAAIASEFGADVDLGLALGDKSSQAGAAASALSSTSATPTAWAPDGPIPGSQAAELGALVQQTRAAGEADEQPSRAAGQFSATDLSGPPSAKNAADAGTAGLAAAQPKRRQLPIVGSPPQVPPQYGRPPAPAVFTRRAEDPRRPAATRLPAWEREPAPERGVAAERRSAPCCRPCHGDKS